ncbi:MAG TPA: SigE family RNA polymerase sigma factor [Actinomycetota bacterium]|nr:SigE family RNA polymerase sigma factor [Actinomycetota bacterium]
MRELQHATVDAPPASFDDFYVREFRGVLALVYALTGDRGTAEDIAQEAFLAAHRSWDRVATYGQPGSWVRKVAVNLSVSAFRRRMTESKAVQRMADRQSRAPELSTLTAEFWQEVRSLPRRQAQAVALFYLEDRPIAEIAAILGLAQGTVKRHLHEGRRTLAERLDLHEDAP